MQKWTSPFSHRAGFLDAKVSKEDVDSKVWISLAPTMDVHSSKSQTYVPKEKETILDGNDFATLQK